jgi:hypothetical protein
MLGVLLGNLVYRYNRGPAPGSTMMPAADLVNNLLLLDLAATQVVRGLGIVQGTFHLFGSPLTRLSDIVALRCTVSGM